MDFNNFFYSGFDFTENEHQLQFRQKLLNVMLLIAIFAGLITAYMYHDFVPFQKIYLTQRNCIFAFIAFILIFVARISKANYNFVLYAFLLIIEAMFTHALFFQVENSSIIFWFTLPILLSYFVGNAFAGKLFTFLTFAILIFYMFQPFVPHNINATSLQEAFLVLIIVSLFSSIIFKNYDKNIHSLIRHQDQLQYANETLDKRINEELKKNREKLTMMTQQSRFAQMGELISMLAHQWRQPLSSVSTSTANLKLLIELEGYQEDTFKSSLDDIDEYVQGLSHTIENFRSYFKPSITKQDMTFEDIMNDIFNLMRDTLTSNAIALNANLSDRSKVTVFRNEMVQAVLNIFTNANEAFLSRKIDNAKITVTASHNSDEAILTITDNAGGIDEKILPYLFDPYFTTKKNKNGSGLGLYLSKTIIEDQCNGHLDAIAHQNGISFVITLPLIK